MVWLAFWSTALTGQSAQQTISVFFDLNVHEDFTKQLTSNELETLKKAEGIVIYGYTDYVHSNEYNQALSEKRAKMVFDYLNSKGLSPEKYEGKGELSNDGYFSMNGIEKHRRVDIHFELPSAPVEEVMPQRKEVVEAIEIIEPEPNTIGLDTSSKENIVLEGLSFIGGRHYPVPESVPVLLELVETMKRYPKLEIEIQGFICCEYELPDGMDQDTQEMKLSHNRAKYVYEFLIENGIDAERLAYVGLGGSNPRVYPEVTQEDMQANRRVELKITAH